MSLIELRSESGITVTKRKTSEDFLFDVGPYAQALREVVETAKARRASDIHIEPTENSLDFRFRIDGMMTTFRTNPVEHRESLILEAKRVFGLAIGVCGRPQDARASFPSLRLDLRVSLLPTDFGEKIVLRLLDLDSTFDLGRLGFSETEIDLLRSALNFESGVVVFSGPTGSGKSKTLYSMLTAADPSHLNVVTLEDPIEYRVKGVNQVQITPKMTFSDGLRSILRQDPDVILVGEIRDEETAKLCFQAAETGHLVLTTLHANGALEVIERLSQIGVSAHALKSSLRLSIAQRLEGKLCPVCLSAPRAQALNRFKTLNPEAVLTQLKERNHFGCEKCVSGILGRVPVLEWARINQAGQPMLERSLAQAKISLALAGTIDSMEVSRATK